MAMSEIDPRQNGPWVPCPMCKANLRPENLNKHLIQVHLLGHPELLPDFQKALSMDQHGTELTCIHCRKSLKRGKLPGHFLRVHSELYLKSPLANRPKNPADASSQSRSLSAVVDAQTGLANVVPSKFDEMLRSHRLAARTAERCECRKVVVFVDLEPRRLKAFDVDHRYRLIGAHSCDGPRSESIHAFNGGAVDSNRRKH